MRSLSATSQKAATSPSRITKKLASLSLRTSRFGKSLPRSSRARALQNSIGKKAFRRRVSRSSPSATPNDELDASVSPAHGSENPVSPSGQEVAGHVAMGPWAGPYEVSPLVVTDEPDDAEDELSPTLLDDAGGSQFALKYLADEALVSADITPPTTFDHGGESSTTDGAASPPAAITSGASRNEQQLGSSAVAAAAPTSPAGQQAHLNSPTNFGGLSEADSEELRRKMEAAALVKAAVWATQPLPRKMFREPRYDRGLAHGRYRRPRAMYVQQPQPRSVSKVPSSNSSKAQ